MIHPFSVGGGVPSGLTRLRLDPDPPTNTGGGGGGNEPPPTPNPNPAPNPTPPPTPEPTNPGAGINELLMQQVAESQRLKAELAEFRQQQAAQAEASEAARLKAIAEKEGSERALEEQRKTWEQKAAAEAQRAQELQSKFYQSERDRTLATGLSGAEWHDAEAAKTAARLLSDDFETRANADGTLAVVEKATGRPASEVIAERIAKPPFTYLQKPKGGGTGKLGGATPPSDPGQPFDYSTAIIQNWNRLQEQANQGGLPALGFGQRPPGQ